MLISDTLSIFSFHWNEKDIWVVDLQNVYLQEAILEQYICHQRLA